jgi:hypothetical protein
MRTSIEQRIAVAAPTAVEVFSDPDFYLERAASAAISTPELVVHRVDGDRVSLELRYAFTGELNAAARAMLDPDRLTWVQASQHDLATGRVVFRILPDHYPDRLSCQGRYRVDPDGEHACLRTVETDVRVRAPLVAGQVERALLEGLARELDAQALAVPDWTFD